jgi:hypothetical protein
MIPSGAKAHVHFGEFYVRAEARTLHHDPLFNMTHYSVC